MDHYLAIICDNKRYKINLPSTYKEFIDNIQNLFDYSNEDIEKIKFTYHLDELLIEIQENMYETFIIEDIDKIKEIFLEKKEDNQFFNHIRIDSENNDEKDEKEEILLNKILKIINPKINDLELKCKQLEEKLEQYQNLNDSLNKKCNYLEEELNNVKTKFEEYKIYQEKKNNLIKKKIPPTSDFNLFSSNLSKSDISSCNENTKEENLHFESNSFSIKEINNEKKNDDESIKVIVDSNENKSKEISKNKMKKSISLKKENEENEKKSMLSNFYNDYLNNREVKD